MTNSPLLVVKRARKLSGACVANAGLAGSWKSGATAAAPLGDLSAGFLHAVAAVTRMQTRARCRMALCYPVPWPFAIVCRLLPGCDHGKLDCQAHTSDRVAPRHRVDARACRRPAARDE